jgi:glycolate oxidase
MEELNMAQFRAFTTDDVIDLLKKKVSDGEVLTGTQDLTKYSDDYYSAKEPIELPIAVVRAKSIDDVVGTLDVMRTYHVPVVTKTTATSLVSGSRGMTGSIVLSLEKMSQILEINTTDQIARVEPGVVNGHLDTEVRKQGYFYAPDPGSKELSSVGGNASTNAGGMSSVRYGVTKDAILGVKVVLADGRVVNLGGRTLKQAFSYDLTQLFVGAEGTLGVIVEITVKIMPIPIGSPLTGIAFFESMHDLAEATSAMRSSGVYPTMLEALDKNTVAAIDDYEGTHYSEEAGAMLIFKLDFTNDEILARVKSDLENNHARNIEMTRDAAKAAALLKLRQDMLPAVYAKGEHVMEDMALPISQVPDMMDYISSLSEKYGLEIFVAGHIGDGNVHPTVVWGSGTEQPEAVEQVIADMFRETLRRGGTISGEHAVGTLKNQWNNVELGEDVDYLQHQIKALLDPMHLLNPGIKIF